MVPRFYLAGPRGASLESEGYGGERGIRTLGAAFGSTHDFQSCSFGHLGHLSGHQSSKLRAP